MVVTIEPQPREDVCDYLLSESPAHEAVRTANGLLVYQTPANNGSSFDHMAMNRGWVVDFINADRTVIHLVPLQEVETDA